MLKTYPLFEVLCLVSAVCGTANIVQTINKSPLYGLLLPIKEKQLREYVDQLHVKKVSSL